MNNKEKLVLILLIAFCFKALSQEEPGPFSFDYAAELSRSVTIPNSPEAQAFTQYGDTPVNMYIGTPNIAIPIYTHQGRELNLPISLTYDATGIKVEQLATNVGLGWNLAVGGRISRITNGNPDDYISTSISTYKSFWDDEVRDKMQNYIEEHISFATEQEVYDYQDFLNEINTNEVETQPDYFSLNALGINDYIVFDINTREAVALNNPNIKVEFDTNANSANNSITDWTITGADGTVYYFEEAEITDVEGNDAGPTPTAGKVYNSSWVLTRVISPNQRDVYSFNYFAPGFWQQNVSVSGYSAYTYIIDENTPPSVAAPHSVAGFIPVYQISQQFLSSITHNSSEIVKINYQNRYDIGASDAIASIEIKNGSTQIYKTYDFSYTYFGIGSHQNPASESPGEMRLKLDEVAIKTENDALYQKYSFEYFSPESVPRVSSKAQDYLGLYNGQGNNSVMFPALTVGGHSFGGANRDPSFSHSIIGTLSRIYYPTGGYTDFEFEPHGSPADQTDATANTAEVIYGILTLDGGQYDGGDIDCGDAEALCKCSDGWCMDLYGSGMPYTGTTTFSIEEAGNYKVKYVETLTNPDIVPNGFKMMGIISKRDNTDEDTNCSTLDELPIGDILDLDFTGNWLVPQEDRVFHNDLDEQSLDINGETTVFLTPGCYQISLVNPNIERSILARVSRVETTIDSPEELAEQQRAGFRIKTIKDYTATNTLAKEKEFIYKEGKASGKSSGVVLYDPQFYTLSTSAEVPGGPCKIDSFVSLHVTGSASGGSTPHVAYTRVFEVLKDGTSNGGYLQHDFKAGRQAGLYAKQSPPFVNFYSPKPDIGQEETTRIYTKNGQIVQKSENDYGAGTGPLDATASSYNYFTGRGLYLVNKPERTYDMIFSRPYGNTERYTYSFEQWQRIFTSTNSGNGTATCAWTYPLAYGQPGWQNYITEYKPTFDLHFSYAFGTIGGVVEQSTTQYLEEGSVETTTLYEYDNSLGFLLKSKTTIDDIDGQTQQTYTYPSELDDTVYQNMVADHQLTTPIIVSTTSGDVVQVRKNNYTAIGSGFYPSSIEIENNLVETPNANDAEERIFYEYYGNGNVKMSYQLDLSTNSGTPGTLELVNKVSYIWGYNNRYPIAKVVNATYSEIEDYRTSLMNLAQADNDRTLGYSGSEGALRQALDTMRNDPSLSHTQITTYTYDPLIGMTSMTDPRGYTTYYDYDEQYRLKHVKDNTGNILSENEYNYRIND